MQRQEQLRARCPHRCAHRFRRPSTYEARRHLRRVAEEGEEGAAPSILAGIEDGRARPEGLMDLRRFIEEFWDYRLQLLRAAAEDEQRRVRRGDAEHGR